MSAASDRERAAQTLAATAAHLAREALQDATIVSVVHFTKEANGTDALILGLESGQKVVVGVNAGRLQLGLAGMVR